MAHCIHCVYGHSGVDRKVSFFTFCTLCLSFNVYFLHISKQAQSPIRKTNSQYMLTLPLDMYFRMILASMTHRRSAIPWFNVWKDVALPSVRVHFRVHVRWHLVLSSLSCSEFVIHQCLRNIALPTQNRETFQHYLILMSCLLAQQITTRYYLCIAFKPWS